MKTTAIFTQMKAASLVGTTWYPSESKIDRFNTGYSPEVYRMEEHVKVEKLFNEYMVETMRKHGVPVTGGSSVMFSSYRRILYPSEPIPGESILSIDEASPVVKTPEELGWKGHWIRAELTAFAMAGRIYYIHYVQDADTLFVWGDEGGNYTYSFPMRR